MRFATLTSVSETCGAKFEIRFASNGLCRFFTDMKIGGAGMGLAGRVDFAAHIFHYMIDKCIIRAIVI